MSEADEEVGMRAKAAMEPGTASLWAAIVFCLGAAAETYAVIASGFGVEVGVGIAGLTLLAAVLLVVGAAGLAFGPRAIVGGSPLAKAGLVVFGAGGLIGILLPFAGGGVEVAVSVAVVLGTSVGWVVVAGGALAAIGVVRARRLAGAARWMLILAVLVDALLQLVQTVSFGDDLLLTLTSYNAFALQQVLLLATGIAWLLAGRTASIRARIGRADASWRAYTTVGGTGDSSDRP